MSDFVIIPPRILSSEGVPFEVTETDKKGVFATWSGTDRNYGWGNTTYMAYTYSKDGNTVYYSWEKTGYTLTLDEPGEYQLFIVGEKEYLTPREKRIEGFDESMLALPEGAFGWADDEKGRFCAVYDRYQPTKFFSGEEDPDYYKGTRIYHTAEKTRVREIKIEPVSKDKKTTDIGVIADAHINFLSEEDKLDAELLFTNRTRLWARNGAFFDRTRSAASFASVYDAVVLAGDIADFLTRGSLDFMKRELFDKYSHFYYAAGGHDVTKNMETGFGDKLPLEERMALLQSVCPNDIVYHSVVINDSVMCVLMYNNGMTYRDGQAEKLEADIKLARERGYTILIFQHEPVATKNPLYSETKCMDPGCSDPIKLTFNYCGSKSVFGAGLEPSPATVAVRDLILGNADVIRGIICGHRHYNYFIEVDAHTPDGCPAVIPQYVVRACAYDAGGCVTKITVG